MSAPGSPLADPDAPKPFQLTRLSHPNMHTHPAPPAMAHVLAVDDEPVIREAIADYLTQYDFRVTTVADGRSMQGVLDQDVVDLVVLDLRLQAEDGWRWRAACATNRRSRSSF